MIRQLEPGYSVEIDRADKNEWNAILERFEDASIYQTWSYGAVINGQKNLSHLVLRKDGEIAGAAQVRISRIPFTRFGVAYVRWGPLWRLRGQAPDPEVFNQAIRALRNEYACRRRLVIRILPLLFSDSIDLFAPALKEGGFARVSIQEAQRTLLINLSSSLDTLRKGLDQKWRNRLNRAERNGVHVIEGYDDDLFDRFIEIYKEMHGRKRFLETSDVRQFRLIQNDLPDSLKMKIMIALYEGKPAAGLVLSNMGEMGVYLLAGTSNAGLNSQGAYLLQWNGLRWLKEKGTKWYNLHGINPETNPGTFRFKSGLCGKNGKDVHYMGTYDSNENSLAGKIVWLANFGRNQIRKSRRNIKKLSSFRGGKTVPRAGVPS